MQVPSLGKGNDNPLQHSCLGNPMDSGASGHRVGCDLVTKEQHWWLCSWLYEILTCPKGWVGHWAWEKGGVKRRCSQLEGAGPFIPGSRGNFEKLNETKIILFNFIPCPQNNAQFLRILMEKRIPSNPEDLLPNGEGSKEWEEGNETADYKSRG